MCLPNVFVLTKAHFLASLALALFASSCDSDDRAPNSDQVVNAEKLKRVKGSAIYRRLGEKAKVGDSFFLDNEDSRVVGHPTPVATYADVEGRLTVTMLPFTESMLSTGPPSASELATLVAQKRALTIVDAPYVDGGAVYNETEKLLLYGDMDMGGVLGVSPDGSLEKVDFRGVRLFLSSADPEGVFSGPQHVVSGLFEATDPANVLKIQAAAVWPLDVRRDPNDASVVEILYFQDALVWPHYVGDDRDKSDGIYSVSFRQANKRWSMVRPPVQVSPSSPLALVFPSLVIDEESQ